MHQGSSGSRQNYDASLVATSPRMPTGSGVALARDPARGVPTMLVAPGAAVPAAGLSAEAAARFHLDNQRGNYKVSRTALAGARLRFVHDLGRGGIVVALKQMLGGVEVFHGDVKVLLDRGDQRLLGISGAPHPAAVPGNRQRFGLAKTAAIGLALGDLYGASRGGVSLTANGERRGGWEHFAVADGQGIKFREPARVKPVYFPLGESLVAAWFVEVQVKRASGEVDAFQHVIAADDGRVLYRRDLTAYEMIKYRVWAEPGGDRRPLDSPREDWSPSPTGLPIEGPTQFTIPTLVQLEGLNHNPNNQPDPWLPVGATQTQGNNADAYVDHNVPDGLNLDMGEFRANTSAPKTFDYIYNTALEPLANVTQSKAAIVQLFYDVNWLHDWWYDSGFVEATGNAQTNNYGRGGVEADAIKAEAQDGALAGSRNNANMSTPADGMQPRMQMFLWTAVGNIVLDVQPAATVTASGLASFGPKAFDKTAPFVLYQDAVAPTSDACEAAVNDVAGKIVLIDRGTCSFESKVLKAQAAGAVGVILANNQGGNVVAGMANTADPDPTIPTLGVTQDNGAALKAALQSGPQTVHMKSVPGVERDGTIDNMVVAHEFGHYLHHRLLECGTKMCSAMSEGWGDFNASLMQLREGDDLDGVFADSTYAAFDQTGYFGIRRVPYSTNFAKNALTFKHVADGVALPNTHPVAANGSPNSEVHNAGEVWASALWEAYVALQKANEGKSTFAEINRLMSDYVVSGFLMSVNDPTFTEQRDAILMGAHANSPADFQVLAEAFARRGLGSCAVSPDKASQDFVGVVEDFELHANGHTAGFPTASDDVLSCDDDGIVDVDEVGTIKITVANVGALPLPAGSTVEIVDPPGSLVFPDGLTAPVEALAPFESVQVAIQVTADDALVSNSIETLKVRLNTPDGCTAFSETFLPIVINADLAPNSTTTDEVDTPDAVWTIGGDLGADVWARTPALVDGYFWHGNDISTASDTWLQSPTLSVGGEEALVISFDHRFTFEFSANTYWDGGLVELSEDGGATWKDATTYGAAPKYIGAINSMLNPINGKTAYANRNAAYPERETEVLNFGMGLAGKDVLFRFRIGTDSAAGDVGWDIDNIVVEGITNQPFSSWIPDAGVCAEDTTTTGDESTGGSSSTGGTDSGGTDSSGADTSTGGSSSTGGTSSTGEVTDSAVDDSGSSSSGGGVTSLETSAGPTDTGVSDTADSDSGPLPTTSGGTNPDPTNATTPNESSGESSESETDTDEPGETVDDGCGCATDGERGWGASLVSMLALLGLGRRRRRA